MHFANEFRCHGAPTTRIDVNTCDEIVLKLIVLPPPSLNVDIYSTKLSCTSCTKSGWQTPGELHRLVNMLVGKYLTINISFHKPKKDIAINVLDTTSKSKLTDGESLICLHEQKTLTREQRKGDTNGVI